MHVCVCMRVCFGRWVRDWLDVVACDTHIPRYLAKFLGGISRVFQGISHDAYFKECLIHKRICINLLALMYTISF